MPICIGDNIKFSINFYNLYGYLNLSTLKWQDPIIDYTPNIPIEIDFNGIGMMNKNRICEVEEMCPEWIPHKYFDKKDDIDVTEFQPQLTVKEINYAGVDIITMKTIYIATSSGKAILLSLVI